MMSSNHQIMDKFQQVYTDEDILRLGGEMSTSVLEHNYTNNDDQTAIAMSDEEDGEWATPVSVIEQQ